MVAVGLLSGHGVESFGQGDSTMEITPRYDGPPIVALDGDGPDIREAFLRQRQRLQKVFQGLSDDEWRAPSRCDEWTLQDVAAHLVTVDGFWALSIAAGLAGTPTRLLEGFDPKATPAALVEAAGSPPPGETLAAVTAATDELCTLVAGLDDVQWAVLAEAPAGHIPIRLLLHHALWDCWIHERDVLLPLGRTADEEPDEVLACLRFVAALGPAFAVQTGTATPSTLVLEVDDLDRTVVVEVGDSDVHVRNGHGQGAAAAADGPGSLVVRGRSVDLVESISARAPRASDGPAEQRWLIANLGEVFESS
jgi:uncharacterized protein (TIGR03083 family)